MTTHFWTCTYIDRHAEAHDRTSTRKHTKTVGALEHESLRPCDVWHNETCFLRRRRPPVCLMFLFGLSCYTHVQLQREQTKLVGWTDRQNQARQGSNLEVDRRVFAYTAAGAKHKPASWAHPGLCLSHRPTEQNVRSNQASQSKNAQQVPDQHGLPNTDCPISGVTPTADSQSTASVTASPSGLFLCYTYL